jgi:hypothetical protein
MPTKRVLLSADEQSLRRIDDVLSGADSAAFDAQLDDEISRFDDLVLSGPEASVRLGTGEIRTDDDGNALLEAVLHPQLRPDGEPDNELVAGVIEDWVAFVADLGGSVNTAFVTVDQGMAFMPLVAPPDAVNRLGRFAQLRVLRPASTIREPRDSSRTSSKFDIPAAAALLGTKRIAVFDGGVDTNAPGLAGFVTDHDLTGGTPVLTPYKEHGTAVCSAALYGHIAIDKPADPPHTAVDHFRVWPPPAAERRDADLMWVLDRITEIVSQGAHRVAVISLAPSQSIEDEEPHPWTSVIDRLAVEHDVLFIVAAGNTGDLAPGLDRLLVPADAVNGLSVGACTEESGAVIRSDYSSVGPGRAGGRTAPTGVQFGGDLAVAPFGALLDDGTVGQFEGTSFAAPIVARAAAELEIAVGGDLSANLLRTMTVHFSSRAPASAATTAGSMPSEIGYGRFPLSFQDVLDHAADAVTIVYDGELQRKDQVTVPFPIPSEIFAAYDTRKFQLRWTLGFLGPVEPANPVDYSCAGLRVVFRPNADRYTLYPPEDEANAKPIPINRRTDALQHQAYIDRGWKQSKRPESSDKAGYAPEVVQRARDGKWETLVRMDRSMKGSSLVDPCLDLHMLGREGGALSDVPNLRWALVLTVSGPAGCELYEGTVQHATQLVPLTTTVPIVSRARA